MPPIYLRKEQNVIKDCLADCSIVSTVSSVCNIYFWIVKNQRSAIVEIQCNSLYGYNLYSDNEVEIIDMAINRDLYVMENLLNGINIRRLECVQDDYQLTFIGKVETNKALTSFTCFNDGFLILFGQVIYCYSIEPFEIQWSIQLPFEDRVTKMKCEINNLFILCENGNIFWADILGCDVKFFDMTLNLSPFLNSNYSNPILPLLDNKQFLYNQSIIYVIGQDKKKAECYSISKLFKSFKIFGCARFKRISLFYIVQEDNDIRTILTVSY